MTTKRINARSVPVDREQRQLLSHFQMALELGGLQGAATWGQARLELVREPEIRVWLSSIVSGVVRELEAPAKAAALEARKRDSSVRQRLRSCGSLLDLLEKRERRVRYEEGLEADRVINESLGLATTRTKQREIERQQHREQLLRQRIEQDEARRRGTPGRWLISR